MDIFRTIEHFDESFEQRRSYTEQFKYFVLVNDIDQDNIVPTCFSVMGPKTCNLLDSLLQPDRSGNKTYGDIVEILKGHFSQEPLVNAERFRFHRRHQEEGESVPMFAVALKKLSEH